MDSEFFQKVFAVLVIINGILIGVIADQKAEHQPFPDAGASRHCNRLEGLGVDRAGLCDRFYFRNRTQTSGLPVIIRHSLCMLNGAVAAAVCGSGGICGISSTLWFEPPDYFPLP